MKYIVIYNSLCERGRDRVYDNRAWNKGIKTGKQSVELIIKRTQPLVGRKHDKDRIIRSSNSHKKTILARTGHLLQCDINGNILNKYDCIQDVDSKLFNVSNLREAIINIKRKGRSGYYKGYYWRYERDGDINIKARALTSKKNHTPIKYRKTNTLIAE